jgi:hypothetical protein
MPTKVKIIQAPCNECGRETDHVVLRAQTKSDQDEEYGAWWQTSYRMIECRGCHFISLERSVTSSEWEEAETEYFPPPISRRKPAWADDFIPLTPKGLDGLLTEVYSALHANNRRLGTMGARALLDMVMIDKVQDVGRFDQKLDALESGAFISKKQRKFLEVALDAGNAASHRGHCPTAEELNLVMDIVESVIAQIYVLPVAAKQLRKSTPKRKRRKTQ